MDLLLVEDDEELGQSLVESFRLSGYRVELILDGKTALARALEGEHRALIVDRMLPGLDGLSLVRALRRDKATPVIFLTTMSGIDDRVQGLEAGGDDYLVKPFAFPELLARVRALTRRAEKETLLVVGNIEIDLLKRIVRRDGIPIELVPQEFRLLEFLAQNANRPVTRRMLLEQVWNVHFDPHTNVVESQVSRLRSRLNEGFAINAIETVRGVGYKLVAPN
ncbi:MAG: response regulator transcription factor [Pseudomonadota bacterium]|nr:response regulator transcription factor [Pseudomonadota bacterium]